MSTGNGAGSGANDIDEFFSTARTSATDGPVELAGGSYRDHLHDLDDPTVARYRGMTYEEFTADRKTAPFLQELLDFWQSLYEEPFVGITSDGTVREGVLPLPAAPLSDDRPAQDAVAALDALLPEASRERLHHAMDSPTWRGWINPEFVFHRIGLRLEDEADEVVDAILAIVESSLSPAGYDRVREAMRLNGYLGELVGLPNVMNDESYWFAVYGDPASGAWGWQLFGHHVAVNFVSVGGRHIIAPVFLGGEPALSDQHPPLFAAREDAALRLAATFTAEQRAAAVVYDSVLDPSMPEGRLHPADERHVAGAFRDNRIVPTEGVAVSGFSAAQRELLLAIIEDFLLLLRDEQRAATMADAERFLDETHFSWYGATDGSQPFYFRVQSPLLIAELDHHAGVWLTNRLPARFHVHTTLRMMNGLDYGKALLAQWHATQD